MPRLDYSLNQKYIAENLCINQDKPGLKCQGKCYVKSETNKIIHEEQDQTTVNNLQTEIIFIFDLSLCLQRNFQFLEQQELFYSNLYTFQFQKENINPPRI